MPPRAERIPVALPTRFAREWPETRMTRCVFWRYSQERLRARAVGPSASVLLCNGVVSKCVA